MDILIYLLTTTIVYIIITQPLIISAQNPPRPGTRTRGVDRKLAVPVGTQATLTCPVDKRGNDLLFAWTKNGESLSVFDNRYRTTGSGSLRIKDTLLEDSGLYTCSAVNGFGAVEITVQLVVFDENGQSLTSTSSTITTTTTTSTTTILPILIDVDNFNPTSYPIDQLDISSSFSFMNPSLEPKISGKRTDGLWLGSTYPITFLAFVVGGTLFILLILLLLLSLVKFRSLIGTKIGDDVCLDGPTYETGLISTPRHLHHNYNMYPIGNGTLEIDRDLGLGLNRNACLPGTSLGSGTGNGHIVGSQLSTPSHFSAAPHRSLPNPNNELRPVSRDKSASPVDSSVIYESPMEFDYKPHLNRKTPYGYLC